MPQRQRSTGGPRGLENREKTFFQALAWGTAWARVEGGKHYPSDILLGAALGNFVAIFVREAALPADSNTRITANISRREISFSVALSF